MQSIKPIYIIALTLVILFALTLKFLNPYKKYSTRQYWENATVETVKQVPEEALKLGNKHGGVLMWAAMSAPDPEIIRALVNRGADVNEREPMFSGTPLTSAAGYTSNPDIIRELINLGADIQMRVNNGNTALMIAAALNTNVGIIEELVSNGADVNDKNAQGQTALDVAKINNNITAEKALMSLIQ